MKKLVTSEIVRKLDEIAINKYQIDSFDLMNNAGKAIAERIISLEENIKQLQVIVIAGKGHNGGDGMLTALNLQKLGVNVKVILLTEEKDLKENAAKSLKKIKTAKVPFSIITEFSEKLLDEADLIVDAIFGTGFNANPEGIFADALTAINHASAKIYSIDVPSGLHGSTGSTEDVAVKADVTITLAYAKIGLFIDDGYTYSGEVEIVDIGIPPELDEEIQDSRILIETSDVRGILKDRKLTVDKKDFGKIFNFAGCLAMPGAAIISSKAALKTGCGLLKLGIPMNISATVSAAHPEIMTYPLAYAQPGYTSINADKDVIKGYKWCDVVLAGPGLSVHPETRKVVKKLFQKFDNEKLVVLDADALNIMADTPEMLNQLNPNIILTPHDSEFARLVGIEKELLKLDRLGTVNKKSIEWRCHIILKGTPTIIGFPNGRIFIHVDKNPALAVGGTGDILSGMLVSFLGQGYPTEEAILLAVILHTISGRQATHKTGEISLLPTDILNEIPQAIKYIKNL